MENYGLSSIYKRDNPYERKAKVTGEMMGNSGFAKPFLAYALGKDLNMAEQWDADREQKGQAATKDAQDREYATEILKRIVEISKSDPQGATKILQSEAGKNPHLASFKDIQFNSETKDNWATVTSNGQAYQVYLPGLAEKGEGGSPLTNEQMQEKGYLRPIGSPKTEAPKTRTYQQGGKDVTEEWDAATGTWKQVAAGPKWNPKAGDGDSAGGPKEFRQFTSQLDGLYKMKASLLRGNDPYTGEPLKPEDRQTALQPVEEQIKRLERYIPNQFPDEWKKYAPSALPPPPANAERQLHTPMSVEKQLDEATAQRILQEAGGDRVKAREIAKQKGYKF